VSVAARTVCTQWWVGIRRRAEAAVAGPGGGKVFGALGHKCVLEEPFTRASLLPTSASSDPGDRPDN